jgi:hypothetical protein
MNTFIKTLLWVLVSIYIGYQGANLLSLLLDPGAYYRIADTDDVGIITVLFIGVPYSILLYVLHVYISPKALNPKYLVPSLSVFIFFVGMWLDNDLNVIRGDLTGSYIAIVGVFVFCVLYAMAVEVLVSLRP